MMVIRKILWMKADKMINKKRYGRFKLNFSFLSISINSEIVIKKIGDLIMKIIIIIVITTEVVIIGKEIIREGINNINIRIIIIIIINMVEGVVIRLKEKMKLVIIFLMREIVKVINKEIKMSSGIKIKIGIRLRIRLERHLMKE